MTSESVARLEPVIASEQTPSFRDGPKDQTSDAQLRIGESRDSGFDASHRPGMTNQEWIASSLSLLAMTLPRFPKQDSAFSRRDFARVVRQSCASEIRGRRECRAHDAPAASGPKEKGTRA
jgi:hypothetical protein